MTLGFSTHWPKRMGGEKTHFVPKIVAGLSYLYKGAWWFPYEDQYELLTGSRTLLEGFNLETKPKFHTIRKGKRWKKGDLIHPVIHNRTNKRFQFAPTTRCAGVQDISIQHFKDDGYGFSFVDVVVDNNLIMAHYENPDLEDVKNDLAINDGFESVEQFFEWFDEDFEGQIIHFTRLTY